MAQRITITCDCCGVDLTAANWFFDQEVCNDCEAKADLAAVLAREDVMKNRKSGETLALMLANYTDTDSLPE